VDFGLIVDLETTGLDPESEQIIEIGLLEFGVQGDEPPQLVRTYGALQDPGVALSPDIVRLTGLTTEILAGQSIDWAQVRQYFQRASIVIAHNADFDRRFLERSGNLQGLTPHWACSMRHIDWPMHGFRTLALNYLAADHGFANPFAHRAVFDCATTFRLVAPHLRELTQRSYEREFQVKAVGSPFDAKDILKQRGYRWDSDERCWFRVVTENGLLAERSFLAEQVYKRQQSPHHEVAIG